MTLEQTLTLISAGYTKDEIKALDADPVSKPDLVENPMPEPEKDRPSDLSVILADAIAAAIAAQKPELAPVPKADPVPAPVSKVDPEPADTPKAEDTAARILAALGVAAQGVAIPKEETLEERMANSLRVALGIPDGK